MVVPRCGEHAVLCHFICEQHSLQLLPSTPYGRDGIFISKSYYEVICINIDVLTLKLVIEITLVWSKVYNSFVNLSMNGLDLTVLTFLIRKSTVKTFFLFQTSI